MPDDNIRTAAPPGNTGTVMGVGNKLIPHAADWGQYAIDIQDTYSSARLKYLHYWKISNSDNNDLVLYNVHT